MPQQQPGEIKIPPLEFTFHGIDAETGQPLIGGMPQGLEKINRCLSYGDWQAIAAVRDAAGGWQLTIQQGEIKHQLNFDTVDLVADSIIFDKIYQIIQTFLFQKFATIRKGLQPDDTIVSRPDGQPPS